MNCLFDEKSVCRYKQTCHNGYLEKQIDTDTGMQVCPNYSNYQRKVANEYKLNQSGIPASTITKSFDSYLGEDKYNNIEYIKKYVETFSSNSKNLYFYGTNGTQKSTVSRILGKEIIAKDFSVKYILTDDLVKLLVRADRDIEIQDTVDTYLNCDLLILDEFEKSKMVYYESGWQLKFIFPFMKKRIEIVNKPSIIISNSMIKRIEKDFDYSLYNLIEREFTTVLTFEDIYIHENTKTDFSKLR